MAAKSTSGTERRLAVSSTMRVIRDVARSGQTSSSIARAKADPNFRALLSDRYELSQEANVFDCIDSNDELTEKVQRHLPDLAHHLLLRAGFALSSQEKRHDG